MEQINTKPPIELIARRLVEIRECKGLSQSELARRAGIGKSTLSQLEAGKGNPSIETLWALCSILQIDFSELIKKEEPDFVLIRSGHGSKVYSEESDYQAEFLSACPPGRKRDIYLIELKSGCQKFSEPHSKGTIEHVYIISGTAKIGNKQNSYKLVEGDYIKYSADTSHFIKAIDNDIKALLIIES